MNQNKIILLFLVTIALAGCKIIRSNPKEIICQDPPVYSCAPVEWKGIAVDTSQSYRKVANEWYEIEDVKRINSPEDEWSLSFLDDKQAILTYDDNHLQRLMLVKISSQNTGRFLSGIGTPFDGSIGALSVRNNKVALAATYSNDNNSKLLGDADLYLADLSGNKLTNITKLGNNLHKDKFSWESQPALSPESNVIFFASDAQPNRGVDLWFTFLQKDGKWSDPINCGDSINSLCDDITPFITKDGKRLFFSSCGHETVGGYDIFSIDIDPAFWGAVKSNDLSNLKNPNKYFKNLKNSRAPLNTKADEIFPSSPDNPDDLLYYASNQNSDVTSIVYRKGGFDLFVKRKVLRQSSLAQSKTQLPENNLNLNIPNPDIQTQDIKIQPTYKIRGRIYDAQNKKIIKNAELIVRQTDGSPPKLKRDEFEKDRELDLSMDNQNQFFDRFIVKTDNEGKFQLELEKDREYQLTAQAKDLFFDTYTLRIDPDDPTIDLEKDFFVPGELTLRINFPTNVYRNPYKYALDSNGIETNQTWIEAINMLAKNLKYYENNLEKLILIGHTDDAGSEEYNYTLGLNRVTFIVNELIKRGVKKELLEARSSGEIDLLPQFMNESLPDWRKRCRRVEMLKKFKS